MATVASQKTPFERSMDNLVIPKADVNSLIMDYLLTEGYPSAAEKFASEANIDLKKDESYIRERVQIRDLIHQGDLEQAIEFINELDSELLDRDKKLHFSLLRLQLIEMIKKSFLESNQSLVASAIEFASNSLAPYAPVDAQFKHDLERAMALLIVPKDVWMNPQAPAEFGALGELVHPDLRRKTAREVNEAILRSQNLRPEANINYLVKARAWAELLAKEKKIALPSNMDIGLDNTSVPQSRNGHTDGGDTEMGDNGGDNDLIRYTNIPP